MDVLWNLWPIQTIRDKTTCYGLGAFEDGDLKLIELPTGEEPTGKFRGIII